MEGFRPITIMKASSSNEVKASFSKNHKVDLWKGILVEEGVTSSSQWTIFMTFSKSQWDP